MKSLFRVLLLALTVMLAAFLLTSCGGEGEEETQDTSKTLVLNVYNWGEYISDGSEGSYDVNAEFEKYYEEKFGQKVRVQYSTYATCEDMYYKIKWGGATYDVIIPSDYMIERMIKEGLLLEFDHSEIENYENIDDAFRGENCYYDREEKYSVPYSYGKVGIIYNDTMVDPEDVEDQSWGLLWNEKYRGKILQFNNPRDGFATAMYYMGLDVNSTDHSDWDKGLSKLMEQKKLVQSYVSDEIFNKMQTGSAAIGTYYAGDYLTMAGKNDALQFYYPAEGTNLFVDAMCIPACSKNPEVAMEYINFMLSEEVAVANAIYIGYASPNKLVKDNPDYIEEMGEDAIDILYSNVDVNENYDFEPYYHMFTPETEQYINGLWEELKTESSTELWVHISSAVIVVGLISYFSYTYVLRRKRSAHYRNRAHAKQ